MAQYVLLARLLAPADLGGYFLALSIANLMMMIVGLGLPPALVRFVASGLAQDQGAHVRSALRKSRTFCFLLSLLVGSLLISPIGRWGLAKAGAASLATALPWTILWGFALGQHRLTVEAFRGFGNLKLVAILGQLVPTGGTLLVYFVQFLAAGSLDLEAALAISSLSQSGFTLLAAGMLHVQTLRHLPNGEADFRPLLRVSVPIGLENIAALAMNQAHLWILAAASTEEQVALFSACNRLTALVTFPLVIAAAAAPPIIAELYTKGDLKHLERVLQGIATVTALPALVLLAPLIFFGSTVLNLLYGSFYTTGAPLLAILAVAQLVSAFSGVPGLALQMTKGERARLVITLASGALGLVVTWVATQRGFGALGTSMGVAVAVGLLNVVSVFAARALVGVWTHASVPRTLRLPQ